MVRIRVKIQAHDGTSKKVSLIDCVCKAEAIVNKIIDNKEAFFLITDSKNMDKLLKDEVRQEFMSKGLEVMYPPEYEAERTVMLKNVDAMIAALSEEEIAQHIAKQYKTKKIVKIPNSIHQLKSYFSILRDGRSGGKGWPHHPLSKI